MALQVLREMATWSFSWPPVFVVSFGALGGLPANMLLAVQCSWQVVVRGCVKRVSLSEHGPHHIPQMTRSAHFKRLG
jgi:hypothetical protein